MDAKVEPAAAAVLEAAPALNPLTRRLLEAPIVPLILRLGWPSMAIMFVQSGAALVDTWWLAQLGSAPLAGMALVFPFVMLIGTVSGGAIGAGISAAVARALGARNPAGANEVLLHGIVINVALGALLTAVMLGFGPQIYRATGGDGEALAAALAYSNIVFAGNVLLWLMNCFASVIRGGGNMMTPALVTCGGALIMVPLSPCLIFGLGPFPAFGIRGSALSLVTYYLLGTMVLGWYVLSGRGLVRFVWTRLRWPVFASILSVGALGALTALQINLVAAASNAYVAAVAGVEAVAGFGTAARLEFLMVPIGFGLGAPLVALVGTNTGAGNHRRAMRIVLIGAAMAFGVTEVIGLAAALFPEAWLHLFTREPQAVAVGSAYLRVVGPTFGFFGLGVATYFALLGANRLFWPMVAGATRTILAIGGGAVAVHALGSFDALLAVLATALVLFGTIPLISLRRRA